MMVDAYKNDIAGVAYVCGHRSMKDRLLHIVSVSLCLLIGMLFLCRLAISQSYSTSTGSPSFAAPHPVELGFVDASSGNLHLNIPLGTYPQRGASQPQGISLEYDSNVWDVNAGGVTAQWEAKNGLGVSLGGWYYSYESSNAPEGIGYPGEQCWTDYGWNDQNGTEHAFHVNANSAGPGCSSTGDAFASDSSGYHIYVTQHDDVVYAPDGTLVYSFLVHDSQGRNLISKDSNGNSMSISSTSCPMAVYDTLGREIIAASSTCAGLSFPVTTSQGTSQYSLTYATINVKSNFQQSGVSDTSAQIYVIRSLTLPDATHSTYYFTYDCDSSSGNAACGSTAGQSAYYGELIGVTLPSGGQVQYSYMTFTDAYNRKGRRVSTHSAQGGTTYYVPQVLSTCTATGVNCKQQTTVTEPLGAQSIYTFQLNNGAWPISVQSNDASGNKLSLVNNVWDMSQPCVLHGCYGASFVRLTAQQTTVYTPSGALTKQETYSYDSPQAGNRTAIKEWKYTSGTTFSSIPDRATYIAYLTTGTNNINRPLSVTLCGSTGSDSDCPGGGAKVSKVVYSYDNYGSNGIKSVTGIVQHDDTSYGASYTTGRGNVTSISQWTSGTNYLTTTYAYDTTGQVITETDPAGNIRTYGYQDSYYVDGGNDTTPSAYSPASATNAYRTSVSDSVGTQTFSYYWGSGKASSVTDYNGIASTMHYQEGLDRQTEEIDPTGWKLATYTSAQQSDMYTSISDASPSSSCAGCLHTQNILDTWGRTTSNLFINNPNGQVNVDSVYDVEGKVISQSHPYSGSTDPNKVYESYGYDGLGKQTGITHPDGQKQLSAFGADIGALGGVLAQQGSVSAYGYGFPQVSMDESGHQHQQWTDGFGQIIEVDEPSTSTASLATGYVSINTGSGPEWESIDPCAAHGSSCAQTIPNSGTVSITIDGYTVSTSFGQSGAYPSFTSAATVASALASEFNQDVNSPVSAVASGASLTLQAKGPGASGNLSFTSTATYNTMTCPNGSSCFGGSAYMVYPSSGALSGGSGGIDSAPYYTDYSYDVAGHLTNVYQGNETRTFAYDGLGRKVSETTPEAGTVVYSYTASGGGLCSGDPSNVCQVTDARGVVSIYTYDHASRLTGVSYTIPSGSGIAAMPNNCTTVPNNTAANVCYYYDQGGAATYAIGRQTGMTDASGTESTAYNADGSVKQISKVIGGQTYTIGYQYNAAGEVTQIKYPSGRTVYQAYNSIGQLCQISPTQIVPTNCSGSGYYAGGFSYNASGNLTGFTYGNGVAATLTYTPSRAQLASLSYAKGSNTYFSLGYSYQQNAANCPNGATGDNGSIQCITDNVDGGRSVNYGYDALGRLSTAKSNGSTGFAQWGLSESYDRYGNRLSQSVTAGSGPSTNLSFSATNQPTGYTFDASGNMTVEPLVTPNRMTYDGVNRMTAFSGGGGAASYGYDGNGLRVVKSLTGGVATVSVYAGSTVIAEYDNGALPASPTREYIQGASGLLAMLSGGAITYYHQDHLSVRLTTDASGTVLSQEGHLPFGEAWYQSGAGNKWQFTSYPRDTESGLDYALARYYNSRTGTFCSADPLAGSPEDPQSWNRYPYGRNNPIMVTDPSGKSWWSSLLIDVGVAVAAYFAPAVAAAWMGAESTSITIGSTQAFSATLMEDGTFVRGAAMSAPAFFAWGSTATSAAMFAGSATAAAQAGNTSTQRSQQPATSQVQSGRRKPCESAPLHTRRVVTSQYGQRSDGFHPGDDLRASVGTSVYSVESGTVSVAHYSVSAGNVVAVQNPSGGYSIYMHMSRLGVSAGQKVNAGDLLGASGNTGRTFGPHLHFEQHTPGSLYDSTQHFNHSTQTAPCRY